jgi:2'-5' RNA ligase
MERFISIIIPLPDLEYYIQDYRFKYDFFAKKGIPVHITFIYKISTKIYYENKDKIKNILTNILKILKKNKITLDKIIENKFLLAIGMQKDDQDLINKLQKKFIDFLNIKNNKYNNDNFKPHITIFTGKDNPGWNNALFIKQNLKNIFSLKINIKKLWILEIDSHGANIIDIIP